MSNTQEVLAAAVATASSPVKWDGSPRKRRTDREMLAMTAKCWELSGQGQTMREIADELGIAVSTVHRYMSQSAVRLEAEAVTAYRQKHLEDTDKLLKVWQPKAEAGDAKAAVIVLKIQERQAKLLGTDKPIQHQTATVTTVDDDVKQAIAALQMNTIPGEVVPDE